LLDWLLEVTTGGAGFMWPDQVIDYVRTAAWCLGCSDAFAPRR
jgi:hypothetical protein